MIQIDPEEVFGRAIWETMQRIIAFLGCLYIGSFLALMGTIIAETAYSAFSSGFTYLPSFDFDPFLMLLPFWSFGSAIGLIGIPFIFIASFFFFRTEEISAKRFIQFTSAQQTILLITFVEQSLDFSPLSAPLKFLGMGAGFLICQLAMWGIFFFAVIFLKNKQRCRHEEHLMTVATENAVWRQKLEDAEFIPPPPSGPQAPKARPLPQKFD